MPFCPNCGKEVSESQNFCPGCGANLRLEGAPPRRRRTEIAEKREKEEKTEKHEKHEKHEKEEVSPALPLVGGLILIFIGATSYLVTARIISPREMWPYLLVLLGVVIIVAAVYASIVASRRSPQP